MMNGPALRDRLERALLYLVTPPDPPAGDLGSFVSAVLDAGVDVVQLRKKGAAPGDLLAAAGIIRGLTAETDAIFIVNDFVELAESAGADGLHLGQDDVPVDQARRRLGGEVLIGLSTHTPAQLQSGVACPADYLAVGPVYPTPTKPGRPAAGLEAVGFAAANLSPKPWFAIGGIDPDSLGEVIQAGARRVAVVRALTDSDDPARAARRMKAMLLSASG